MRAKVRYFFGITKKIPYFLIVYCLTIIVLVVLQINHEATALSCRIESTDNEHLLFGILDSLLQVIEATHGLVVQISTISAPATRISTSP